MRDGAATDARETLKQLTSAIESHFGSDLLGLYLFGSLAAGSFYAGKSDLDLMAIVVAEVEEGQQLEALRSLHDAFVSERISTPCSLIAATIAFDGSTAMTRATCGLSARAKAPVPAPRSTTVLVAPTPSAGSTTSSLHSVDDFWSYPATYCGSRCSEPACASSSKPKRWLARHSQTSSRLEGRFRVVSCLGPVFGNDARQVIPFGAGRYAFMSARSMVKLDTNAGKPSLTPLH